MLTRGIPLPSKQDLVSNLDYGYAGSKYADLFCVPPQHSNLYSFEPGVPVYPLDTVIPSYPLPFPQKSLKADSLPAAQAPKSPGAELESLLLGKPDDDLLSLLSFPTITNADPPGEEEMADFAIPSFSSALFDLFPMVDDQQTKNSPDAEEVRDPQQPSDFPNMQLCEPLTQEEASLWMPPSTLSSSLSMQLTSLPNTSPVDPDPSLPVPSSSPPHSNDPPQSNAPLTAGEATGSLSVEEQMNFLNGTFDYENLFPSAKKIPEFSSSHPEALSPASFMHISPPPTPHSSTPTLHTSSPPTPQTPETDAKPDLASSVATEKSKPAVLLFGKHEDEILIKLLRPIMASGSRSQPVTKEKLVSMPVEEFNRLLEAAKLEEIDVAFMKEWRRRGKNKTAAMVARKRKRDELSDLDEEVAQLRKQKGGLQAQCDQLRVNISALKERTRHAEDRVYQRYSRQNGGVKVSRETHVIHIDHSSQVLLAPRPQQMIVVK